MEKSLKLRLLILILLPLIIVSSLAMLWRIDDAKKTAEEIFDRNLMMLAFAISRDVTLSEGDSLSETTLGLFQQASGGNVFYHIYGPDGSFITGYSSPPVQKKKTALSLNKPKLFNASHLGIAVRVVQLAENTNVDGIFGTAVVTAWQTLELRKQFALNLALRTGILTAFLIFLVAALVLIGIKLSLKPLADLEDAIKKRSADDLSPIIRHVPKETQGIVSRLNDLFRELINAQTARDRFISNAAHQLRNPISGIHTMAQATANARTLTEAKSRASELLIETRLAARITEQLLSLERLDGRASKLEKLDLNNLVRRIGTRYATKILNKEITFSIDVPSFQTVIHGDEFLLTEAIQNLIDNAVSHGGGAQTFIEVKIASNEKNIYLSVENDGLPIPNNLKNKIFERFTQGPSSEGSGLGLTIVHEIIKIHQAKVLIKVSPITIVGMIFSKKNI
jgi:two-component system sensor histidine kinase TctE